MSFKRVMKGQNTDRLPARGLFHQNVNAITACQSDCIRRLGKTIQLEQEAYLINHPEVKAMLEGFVCKMVQQSKKKDILKEAAQYFTRTVDELECEIKEFLGLPVDASDIKLNQPTMYYEDYELKSDLQNIIREHYPPEPWTIPSPISTTPATLSSSFLSCVTSETTLPTPEPEAQPELTLSQIFYNTILGTVDKAVYQNVDAATLKFDTAYVELQKVVEQAMEIPVIEIREDIAELLYNSYKMFELNIMEKERIAAEIAWEKRMRKKLKKTLRRQMNFKGYETPPTPKSEISSHESYKKPMPKCCVCHPQNNYNRYPKDRFGIYLPRETSFSNKNVTATPNISLEDVSEDVGVDSERADTKSLVSRKSAVSTKSNISKLKEKE